MWRRLKRPFAAGSGTSEALLPSYISEFVVREREQEEFGLTLFKEIVSFTGEM